ncbi:MAG: HD domain-containing phosphohydrolase [Candidatus Omnitrophota bacterium]
MIRMSDIIKMNAVNESGSEKKVLLKETQKQDIPIVEKESEIQKLEGMKLYNRGINLIEDVLNKARVEDDCRPGLVVDFAKILVENVLTEEDEQSLRFYEIGSPQDYLPSHSFNVSFMSTKIGMWYGLNKSQLTELFMASFLHDVGMIKVESIVRKEHSLSTQERMRVQRHPEYSEQMIRKMDCLGEDGLNAVKTHHCRGQRDIFSQIISLADIYEAITHPRVYKPARSAHQAIGEVIEKETENFEQNILKAFVNNIGIYPVGSWVALNTGETGMVIGANKGYPLRPKVNIIFDREGEQLKEKKILDFLTEPYFYIEGPFDIAGQECLKTAQQAGN